MEPKGYTTRAQIENYLLITVDPTFYTQVDEWIAQIETYIEQMTGRIFKADSATSERTFDGDGSVKLLIDDAVEIEEVKLDETIITDSESGAVQPYVIYPANSLPKTMIQLKDRRYPAGLQNITVKARWGYSENTPNDIVFAATVLASGVINYSLNAEGEVKTMSIGRYSVTYKDEKQWQDFERVEKILDYYRKFSGF